jgi:hypothetical protein
MQWSETGREQEKNMRITNSIFPLFLATAALGVTASGCARHRAEAEVSPNAVATVRVENHHFNDMNVWATRPGGDRIRLGMVTGASTTTFKLPRNLVAFGSIDIVAVPIGGFGRARSGELSISPGETIVFRVEQRLASSNAVVERP